METEGLSAMTIRAIVVGAVALAVAIALLLMYRRRSGDDAPQGRPRPPREAGRARAERAAEGGFGGGGTLRLDGDGHGAEEIAPAPLTEANPDGATLRLVNACPNHPGRRAQWTCPYCHEDFCPDCRRRTGALDHCPGERCGVRAAHAAGAV